MLEKIKNMLSFKRGNLNSSVQKTFGAVILIYLVVALLPGIFTSLANGTIFANTPTWVVTIFQVIVGAGFTLLVWKQMMGAK